MYLAPLRTLARTLSTWDPDPHLGQPNFQTGLLPVSLAVSAIDATGLPAWLVLRVWRTLLLLVAGWGAVRLFHLLAAETSCYRYWGEGVWTDYGAELSRRVADLLAQDP